MNVSVLIPYRPFWRHDREEILRFVRNRFELGFPDWEIVIGVDDPNDYSRPFNRALAVNEAARRAYGDVFLICDADTICNETYLWQALNLVQKSGSWVLPYEIYYNLNPAFTSQVLSRMADTQWRRPGPNDIEHALDYVVSGMVMLPRTLFDEAGGMDERFLGWGYEDDAFAIMLTAFGGEVQRVPDGFVTHLYHEPGARFDSPNIRQNRDLYMEYRKRRHDRWALKALKGA